MRATRYPAGISVIEVMIALGIAVIIVISVGSLIISTHSLDTEATKQLQAVGFAKQWLEVVDVQRNALFGCSCGAAPCASCTASDGQTCAPQTTKGYRSCWVSAPLALAGTTQFRLTPSGGSWLLQAGTDTPATGFTRSMAIVNLQRDAAGAIVATGGTEDFGTKQVTVTVQWLRAGTTRQVEFSEIVTAWKDF